MLEGNGRWLPAAKGTVQWSTCPRVLRSGFTFAVKAAFLVKLVDGTSSVARITEEFMMRRIRVGDWIENPMAGLKLRFTGLPEQTGGQRYEAEFVHQPFTGKNAAPL